MWRKVNFGVCPYCSAVSLCYHWCPDCVPTLIPAEGLAPGAELIQLGSRYETSWQIPVSQRERCSHMSLYLSGCEMAEASGGFHKQFSRVLQGC